MKNNKVYLTFPTDQETAHQLTQIAHILGMTQPKLIEALCKNFINTIEKEFKEAENT